MSDKSHDVKPSGRALIVDDNREILEFIAEALTGYIEHTTCVDNGLDALERIGKGRYEVMLLDLQMPGMKGLEVLKRVRTIDAKVKVIIITGYASLSTAISGIRLGVFDYLKKPFDADKIRLTVVNAVRLYELERERDSYVRRLQNANRLLEEHRQKLQQRVSLANDELIRTNCALNRRVKELNVLHRIEHLLNADSNKKQIIQSFLDFLLDEMDMDKIIIFLSRDISTSTSLTCFHTGNVDDSEREYLVRKLPDLNMSGSNAGSSVTRIKSFSSKLQSAGDEGDRDWIRVPLVYVSTVYGYLIYSKHYSERIQRQNDFSLVKIISRMIAQWLSRMKAKEELTSLEQLHQNILRNMYSGLVSMDSKGRINYSNAVAAHILGLDGRDISGLSYLEVFHFADDDVFHRTLYEGKKFQNHEVQVRLIDERIIPLGMTTSPIVDERGEFTGVVAIFTDLTSKKKIEEEIRRVDKYATLGEITTGMAHEIKNPLSGIKTTSEFLKSRLEQNNPLMKYLDLILEETIRLDKIISDFLNYGRPSKQEYTFNDIHGIIDRVLALLQERIEEKNIRIQKVFNGTVPQIECDYNQMEQVFLNIILNSIQIVSDYGNIRIETDITEMCIDPQSGKPVDTLRIAILDDGPGIPDDMLEKVFHPFFTTKSEGTGLGLCISQRLVEEHQGKIEIESEIGRGTAISIFLPFIRSGISLEKIT
jgi:PAS domain S-box-containing protein